MPDVVSSACLACGTFATWSSTPAVQDVIGCLGAVVTPLLGEILAYCKTEDFWHKADAFAFLGVIDWTDQDQAGFEAALTARPRPVFVAIQMLQRRRPGIFPQSGLLIAGPAKTAARFQSRWAVLVWQAL